MTLRASLQAIHRSRAKAGRTMGVKIFVGEYRDMRFQRQQNGTCEGIGLSGVQDRNFPPALNISFAHIPLPDVREVRISIEEGKGLYNPSRSEDVLASSVLDEYLGEDALGAVTYDLCLFCWRAFRKLVNDCISYHLNKFIMRSGSFFAQHKDVWSNIHWSPCA